MAERRWILVLAFMAAVSLAPPAAAAEEPRAIVESFQGALIDVMKEAKKLGVRGRYERLMPVIEGNFHVPLMAQIVAGAYWGQASVEQRQKLIAAFRRMSVGTLATLFDGYDNEKFVPTGERDGPQATRVVDTRLVKSDGSTNDIAYVAKKFPERWYLIDVVVDRGISELSVRRSEYHRVLKDRGIDGLIGVLNAKADELLAAKGGAQ